ncbi:MAG: DUF3987 domain-containing protein [Acidobacteria bacterium]|nr:DUF3987 domain-containing protein [Acidobacteriota bacterium]
MSTSRNPFLEVAGWAPSAIPAEAPARDDREGFDLEAFIARNLSVNRGPLPWDSRGRKWELKVCPFNAEHTGGCAVVTQGSNGAIGFKCQHNGCANKHWQSVRALFDGPGRKQRADASGYGGAAVDGTTSKTAAGVEVVDEATPWEDPIPFRSRQTPPIAGDLLPGFLGEMVSATARATETPTGLAAMLGLAVVAASVAKKVVVCPEQGYREPVNIYAAVGMESGNRKTAVLGRMTRPFIDWEESETHRLRPEIERVASERKTQEARIESLRRKAAKALDPTVLMAEIAELESSLPEIPRTPRLWTQDITSERLGALMAEQGERIALLSDEGGVFDVLAGRYSKGIPNLDLFLQAHAGASVRVDRGSRPPVMLRKPALTVGISPQPDVLESLSDKPGFRGRGLIARFLYGLPVSLIGFRGLTPVPCPSSTENAYAEGIARLLSWVPPTDDTGCWRPWDLRFSAQAYGQWKDFQRSVEVQMREGGKLYHLKDWGSKLPGTAARVAGGLHCVVADPRENAVIDVDTVDRTLGIVTPLIDHALAVFNLMERDKNSEHALKILAWLRKRGDATFSLRECFCAYQYRFKTMGGMRPTMLLLEQHYYIRPCSKEPVSHRPSEVYAVNPTLLESSA